MNQRKDSPVPPKTKTKPKKNDMKEKRKYWTQKTWRAEPVSRINEAKLVSTHSPHTHAHSRSTYSLSEQITKAHIIKQMFLFSVVSLPVASCILLIHARATTHSLLLRPYTQSIYPTHHWCHTMNLRWNTQHTNSTHCNFRSRQQCEMRHRPTPITTQRKQIIDTIYHV